MSNDRRMHRATFLAQAGWQDAEIAFLAGDASNRSYKRLSHPEHGKAVLMDAPPNKGEDTGPFIKIARHLRANGLSAPEIFAQNNDTGFLLIEDLGDALLARVLERAPAQEEALYQLATDALIQIQNAPLPAGIQTYGAFEMSETAMLAIDWYLKFAAPDHQGIRKTFHTRISKILTENLGEPSVLVHRDYHAENLIWMPNRTGAARLGILDFQDAMLGYPAYDLASLLKDARRDVSPAIQKACIEQFATAHALNPEDFLAAYACCSAQRNLRIMGVFARLSIRDGKRTYPDMLPRVWRNLKDDLKHTVFADFGPWITDIFPEPTPEIIAQLKTAHV